MMQKDNILRELNELKSILANMAPENPYTMPQGYFDGLAAQLLNRIKALEATNAVEELGYLSPTLSNVSKQMPYTVPAGYLEGLTKIEMQSTGESNVYPSAKEELGTLAPLLAGLKKEMPYSIPQGYFENLNINKKKQVTKVVAITNRKWFQFAAAAVIIGIIAMAAFLFLGGEKEPGGKILVKFTRDIKKMNDAQKDNLVDFIDAGMTGDETAQAITDNKPDEVKNLLLGISDEELTNFQQQTEDIQDVLMTN